MAINVKIVAIVVVAIVVVASAGILLVTRGENRNEEINLVLGAEAVGSGIYYDPSRINPEDLFVTEPGVPVAEGAENVIYRAAGWNKLIFGSPNTVAVQHFQLKTIVEVYLNDPSKVENGETREYKLVAWQQGIDLKDGEVGYIITTGAASSILQTSVNGSSLAIGLTWQPQLSKVVGTDPDSETGATQYETLVRTNELFPDQTCCVLYVNASYYAANPELSERFVWAIIQATDWLNAAKDAGAEDPNDVNYQKLLSIGKTVGGETFTEKELIKAFEDVLYSWWNGDSSDPLGKIKEDIASQVDLLLSIGGFQNTLSDLGFDNSSDFADRFVNDSLVKTVYQKYYVGGTGTYDSSKWNTPTSSGTTNVRVGVISGDLHHIAVYIANTLLPGQTQTFFEQVGISITPVYGIAGASVLASLKANEADFAMNSQPSVLTDNINNKLTVNK